MRLRQKTLLLLWLFFLLPAKAELMGQPCIELDGADHDMGEPYPYQTWQCFDLALAPIDGTVFQVRLRWNLSAQPILATVVWLAGANGDLPHAVIEPGVTGAADERSLRERFAQDYGIRSIELQFLNARESETGLGGYWAAPRRGYLKPAQAYLATIEFLLKTEIDLIQGEWWTQVAISNGATTVAFALAYLNADELLEKTVLLSGPFLANIKRECSDPDFVAYIGRQQERADAIAASIIWNFISAYNGWNDCRQPLQSNFQDRELLSLEAQRNFGHELTVITGAEDEYGPWLLASNVYWYQRITANLQSRVVLPEVPHGLIGYDSATEALLLKHILWPPGLIPPGVFMLQAQHIYYSNGGAYCYFNSINHLQRLTGLDHADGLVDYENIPPAMIYDGMCAG